MYPFALSGETITLYTYRWGERGRNKQKRKRERKKGRKKERRKRVLLCNCIPPS
jgi:hypothetical protein